MTIRHIDKDKHHQIISHSSIKDIFLGNFNVLKFIEKIIMINIATNEIKRETIETSANIKKDRIIVNILLTLVYGIIKDIFSFLYIFWYIWDLNISVTRTITIKKNKILSILVKLIHENKKYIPISIQKERHIKSWTLHHTQYHNDFFRKTSVIELIIIEISAINIFVVN